MGTVKEVSKTSLTIETKEKKTVTVAVDSTTTFEHSGMKADVSHLEGGERVVVHAKKTDKGMVAQLVKWGSTSEAGKPGGHPHAADAGTKEHGHSDKH